MAKSVGSAAKSNSRRCFTFVSVTTPTAPSTPLPTKFAAAEKHMARLLRYVDYTYRLRIAEKRTVREVLGRSIRKNSSAELLPVKLSLARNLELGINECI